MASRSPSRRPDRARRPAPAAFLASVVAAFVAAAVASCGAPRETPAPESQAEGAELTPEAAFGAVPASQPAIVVQRLAQAEITVTYSRPVARGREIFGHLVPWDAEWNPGADHATYLRTTADISVAGRPLSEGRYSIYSGPADRRPHGVARVLLPGRRPPEWPACVPLGRDVDRDPDRGAGAPVGLADRGRLSAHRSSPGCSLRAGSSSYPPSTLNCRVNLTMNERPSVPSRSPIPCTSLYTMNRPVPPVSSQPNRMLADQRSICVLYCTSD